jgi:protein-tyrosine phosphatase
MPVTGPPPFNNFRDLGGIRTTHGPIARGRLFRTAHLSYLDEALATELTSAHGVRTYLDFRTDDEIARDGVPKPLVACGVRWERRPFNIADDVFWSCRVPSPSDWSSLYTRAFERFRPHFADIVGTVSRAPTPLVFGCWAGKDRTGMVAAVLLSLLGVSEAAIVDDYARTTEGLAPLERQFAFLGREDPELNRQLLRSYCDALPEIIHGFLVRLRDRHGSVQGALAVPDATLAALRAALVE